MESAIAAFGIDGAVRTHWCPSPAPNSCAMRIGFKGSNRPIRAVQVHGPHARLCLGATLRNSRINDVILEIQAPVFRVSRDKLLGRKPVLSIDNVQRMQL